MHPEIAEDFGFAFTGSKSNPVLLRKIVNADVSIASPGTKNVFHAMTDSDDQEIHHKDIENDFVVLKLDETNLKAGMYMDLYSEIGHHSMGAVSINTRKMTEQQIELRSDLRVGVMTVLGNCTIYPNPSDQKGDKIYARAFYLGEKAQLVGSNKEGKLTSLSDIKAFRENDRHKFMRLESLSYHYPDDPLAGAVSNDALKYLDFYGVEQDLVNNQDTFWINGKVVGEVNLRGGAHLFTSNYMQVDLSSKNGRQTIDYKVSSAEDPKKPKSDFAYVDDVIVEDGMVHIAHVSPMLGRKLFLKDDSKFYLRTSTQFVHKVDDDPAVYERMKTNFTNVLKEFKPKSVEKVVDKDIDGEHETYQLNLGHRYAMYMEHIVLHGTHQKVFRLDDKGSQVDFFGNTDGKWDLGNGAFYIPLIFVEDNSLTQKLEHYKDRADRILVLGIDDKASEIAHAKLRLYHEDMGHDMLILMQVKGEKDLSSGLALNMAKTLQGSMSAKAFYSSVESVDPFILSGVAQTGVSNLQEMGYIANYDFCSDLISGNKLKLNDIRFGQTRHRMLSAQKLSYRFGTVHSLTPKASYTGIIIGKSFGDKAYTMKFGGACANVASTKAKVSRSQFNIDASFVKNVEIGGGVSLLPNLTLGVEYSKIGAYSANVPLGGRRVPFLVQAKHSSAFNVDASCGLSSFDRQIKLVAGFRSSFKGKQNYECILNGKIVNLQKIQNDMTPYLSYDFAVNGVTSSLTVSLNQVMLSVGASM